MSKAKTANVQKRDGPDSATALDFVQVAAGKAVAVELERAVRELHENAGGDKDIADAKQELEAIVDTSATAASAILDACEAIELASEGIPAGPLKDRLQDATRNIYLACGFQDLTGQRARKAMARLDAVDRKVGAASAVLELAHGTLSTVGAESVESADQALLNGPALANEAMTQREIDRIMALLDLAIEHKAAP